MRLALLASLLVPLAQDKVEWQELRSEEGNFLVWLPGKAEYQKGESQRNGQKIVTHQWTLSLSDDDVFIVAHNEIPNLKDVEAELDSSRDGAVEKTKGKLLKEKKRSMGRFPGRHVWVEADGYVVEARFAIVQNRQYLVLAVGLKDKAKTDLIRKVLDSMKLIDEDR